MKTAARNVTPENITKLDLFEVFVFGSNMAGIHGAGAAKQARQWGARMGEGFGHQGRTWAMPTKDHRLNTLPLDKIETYVRLLMMEARVQTHRTYLVTTIGCGLAGYTPKQIAPLFFRNGPIPSNMYLPQAFWDHESK